MEQESTAKRLKQVMKEQNLKQVDILKKTESYCHIYGVKLGRNDLSQYLSGKVEPGQKKLMVLSQALNVNPVWLMGYNVDKEYYNKNDSPADVKTFNVISSILDNVQDRELLYKCFRLNSIEKENILKQVNHSLSKQGDYFEKDYLTGGLYDPYENEYKYSFDDIDISNKKNFDELEMLFYKAKPHLSDDDKETMKFLMQKTINNYEKSKNQGGNKIEYRRKIN